MYVLMATLSYGPLLAVGMYMPDMIELARNDILLHELWPVQLVHACDQEVKYL